MGQIHSGKMLSRFILLTICCAGIVLLYSAPKKYKAALIQFSPAFIGLISSFFI
jgi:uncharacterized membrane protein